MMHFIKQRLNAIFIIFILSVISALLLQVVDLRAQDNEDWEFTYQREEIAPRAWKDMQVLYHGKATLAVSGNGLTSAYGTWTRTVEAEPGESYLFTTHFKSENVEEPHRCIFSRLLWLDEKRNLINRAEYPDRDGAVEEWKTLSSLYKSPPNTHYAKLELVYRWDPDGTVYFGGTELSKAADKKTRLVRIASIYHRPRGTKNAGENLDSFAGLVRKAGEKKPDLVLLPEGITVVSTGQKYVDVSEPVPGPTTEYLGKLAKEFGCYIIAGLYERVGTIVYNTSVLIDRKGELAGSYRKVCLPREEYDGGITPGDSYPVFDTDFGRIGMLICWDLHFPDGAKMLALRGAEMILIPIWGGNLTLARARAIENQVYLVTSSYDMKTAVFNLEGEIIAEATEADPVLTVDIDLNERKLWNWLGDYRSRIPREMPPLRAIQYPDR